ncbi:MAG: phosphate signaling complex protein PhoU [Micrococcales bacterium]|nr:phosphate signaling complex protein PhoU [Micrococcales bacterium]MCL2668565.1 phosphate signaling complex protein PhoU [Micrococcales bacterium]
MREIFEAELTQLGDDLVAMARRVETAIESAGQALLTADLPLAESVIAGDMVIDALNRDLDERCVMLLARQQPVATDLRVIISALRIASSLERMGDLARHVAQVARRCYPQTAAADQVVDLVTSMSQAADRVGERTVRLLATRDLALADEVERDDDLLDELHTASFAIQLGDTWTGTAQQVVNLTLLARYYERFGDHGVSIARRIRYLVTGEWRTA